LLLGALTMGCGPSYVRGSEVEGLDDSAMSTGLDKRDLQQALHEHMKHFVEAKPVQRWAAEGRRPRLAIYAMANETTEHIDGELSALVNDVETYLVGTDLFDVISSRKQHELMNEIARQHGGGFDASARAEVNRQLGAEYFITGEVATSDERNREGRRVQYYMFMELLDVATGAVVWKNKVDITKAVLD
jgi:penicillin-binding protein activator